VSGLSFFRPEFLWGLLFTGAVLLIHLLRRPRARVLEFSTLRFFRHAAVTATRMRRLRNLLLLLARCMAVCALALLFAQPFSKSDPLSVLRNPQLTLFSWIDPTPGMGYTKGSGTLYERGRALVDSIVEKMAPPARHFFYDETSRDFLLREGDNAAYGIIRHGPCGLDKVISAWSALSGGYSLPCLLIASDFERLTTMAFDSLVERIPPGAMVICLSLAPEKPWNYALYNAAVLDSREGVTCRATVRAIGRPIDSGKVTATLGGLFSGGATVSVAQSDTAEVLVKAVNAAAAPGGALFLDASDPLPFDNTVWCTMGKRSGTSVMVLGDAERAFPLAAAFSAASDTKWAPITHKRMEDATYDLLDSSDVIAIPDFDRPVPALESIAANPLSGERVVIIGLDTGEDALAAAAALLSRSGVPAGRLTPARRNPPASLVLPDTISGLWQGFPSRATREALVYRYVERLPGTVLVRFDNGAPAMTLVSGRKGMSFILVATPLGVTDANNLCETGFYVACIDRIVRYAMRSFTLPQEEWIAGVERRNPFHGSKTGASLFGETGTFIERWQSQQSLIIRDPGIYRLAPEGETAYWITVSADPRESRLDYVLPSIPDRNKNKIIILDEKKLIEALHGRGRLLSMLPWALLLLFLFAETLLWESPSRKK
jgi:hypothetical protein